MDKIVIAFLVGTVREGRSSIHPARFIYNLASQHDDIEALFVDPREHTFAGDGSDQPAKDPRYSAITARADAFFVITPEYNHSFPGSLKRMLDSEYSHYAKKAVAIAGVSDGDWGGARAVEALLPVFRTVGLYVTQFSTYFPRTPELFNEQGKIREDQVVKYTKSVTSQLNELVWLARALKDARL